MEDAVIPGNPAIGCPVPVLLTHLPAEAPGSYAKGEGAKGVEELS